MIRRTIAGATSSGLAGRRLRSSSPPAGRGAPGRPRLPQRSQRLLDPPSTRIGILCAFDSTYVLSFATVGQALIRGARDWIDAEGVGEVRGLGHDTRFGIEFQLHLDLVADLHTCGSTIGVAEAKKQASTHDGDPALP